MTISAITRRDPFLAAVQDSPAQQRRYSTIAYCTACWITWNDFLFFRNKSKNCSNFGSFDRSSTSAHTSVRHGIMGFCKLGLKKGAKGTYSTIICNSIHNEKRRGFFHDDLDLFLTKQKYGKHISRYVTTVAVVLQIQLKKQTVGKSNPYGLTIVFYHPQSHQCNYFLGHAVMQENAIT